MVALVEVHLRAGPAGAGIAHGPEIVLLPEAQDAIVAQPGDVFPELEGVVVIGEDGRLETILGQSPFLGEEIPAVLDGLLLEVVPEGEIAQHLEEGVMPGGAAHVLEVVVLAPRPHALLSGYGSAILPLLLAEEHALELVHARVGEEKGRVVARHERGGAHDRVPPLAEIVEEALAQLVAGHGHDAIIPGVSRRGRPRRAARP